MKKGIKKTKMSRLQFCVLCMKRNLRNIKGVDVRGTKKTTISGPVTGWRVSRLSGYKFKLTLV